jgi:hypothetical protein
MIIKRKLSAFIEGLVQKQEAVPNDTASANMDGNPDGLA